MPIKSEKMKISKNKKMRFFLMSQGSFNPKIRFLVEKVCPVACLQTDRRTDRQSDHCGHPFRVSGFFNLSSRIGPKTFTTLLYETIFKKKTKHKKWTLTPRSPSLCLCVTWPTDPASNISLHDGGEERYSLINYHPFLWSSHWFIVFYTPFQCHCRLSYFFREQFLWLDLGRIFISYHK